MPKQLVKKVDDEIEVKVKGTLLETLELPTAKINQFKRKKIDTIEELLDFFPRKYYDFRYPTNLKSVKIGEPVAIVLKCIGVRVTGKMTIITTEDEMGGKLALKFFDLNSGRKLQRGCRHIVCGVVTVDEYFNSLQMVTPYFISKDLDAYPEEEEKYLRIIPIYSSIKGMSNDYIQQVMERVFEKHEFKEELTEAGLNAFRVISSKEKYRRFHFPKTLEEITTAKRRDAFDDLYSMASEIHEINQNVNQPSKYKLLSNTWAIKIIQELPFELTEDQKNTLNSIVLKTRAGKKTQSMVMGDVGSGKTIVAILLLFMAAENGFQGVLMAPTGVLASQHHEEVRKYAEKLGIKTAYLCSGMKVKEKKEALAGIASGEISIIVGTHAAISESVQYQNLGLVIVDEQHRFGVAQRAELEKRSRMAHFVDMTATPIPRSLAITIYGEGATDIYTIKSKPKGRKPIITALLDDEAKVYDLIKDEVSKGYQAYVVCPLVDPSESEALESVESATETHKKLQEYFANTNIKVGITTGKMDKTDMDEELLRFKNKEYDILVATTIIEVGVNVPNSTIIAIKNAERFGLAQLHQLRGRVGRNSLQSYCYLISRAKDNEKLVAMTQTNDGFKISEKDLEIRGAGDFMGTRQSGDNKKLEMALRSPKVFAKIKELLSDSKLRLEFLTEESKGLFY